MVSTLVSIPGYRISEELYNSSRTLVYRGYRETDSLRVVIKLLKNPYPSFSELLSFRNQYTIAKNLNSPLIVQTYSLEPFQNGYALVMEDFGGISLKEWGVRGRRQSLQEFLVIAIALCNTLDVLYRAQIIHKDIKPANILINPETKQVKLIDFSIASLLPRETQTLINPNVLEGTLAYISPEQTGRMNRGMDYRTDFYSVGVTFYELLTGVLPFQSNDPMELVHCHIAFSAPLVDEINPQIPSVLSLIVSKLMAKNAEDRYQSALGLKLDLENCLTQLQVSGKIEGFEIGQGDVCDRFIIPDKLYGRETEVSTLIQAFERVSLGATEMILVAGFSGIGKTAVVNEVHKPIVRQRGYFIKGKYDQFQRNIPLSAFVQAFRDLMGQLLTLSDAQIQQWKSNILDAVGENGQVIIEVIPELSRIIGEQPPAIELSGTAAENRFNLLFQKFTQVFTSGEHPLVMFLDDLQWADSASLKLMQLLIDTKHLLLIGAYRLNEVTRVHPLMLTLSEIQKTPATINTITLAPLSQVTVNQLVADTLKCTENLALTLSMLVYRKTQGNPFFATQFLLTLHQERFIQFDFDSGCWECDITQVNQQAFTDDVVAFMAFKLQKLPPSTQQVLQLAACIGNQFDLATLAIVSEQPQLETAADLWKALQEGLILPISDVYKFYQDGNSSLLTVDSLQLTVNGQPSTSYKFLHDRVQQAAYSLIPDDQKTATHLQIGNLLQKNLSEIELDEKLFDITQHLNLGIELITELKEQETLAQLNLKAGAKSKNSTAYAAARVYLQTGIKLLQTNCWQHQYELTLNLYVMAAEVAYLNGDFEGMEQLSALVLQEAQSIFDKVKIYKIQIAAQTARSQILAAIAVGTEVLSQLGVNLPSAPDKGEIGNVLQDLASLLSGREIAGLIDLPMMNDPTAIAAMQLLGMLFSSVLQGMPGLLPLLSATMVRLSLQFGNAPTSTVGYMIHGTVLCAFLGEIETGYRFGLLALSLLERLKAQGMKSITLNLFGAFIQHRRQALLATLPALKEGYITGMESGEFLHAGYSIFAYTYISLFAGVDLDTLAPELAAYSAALAQVKQNSARIYIDMVRQTVQQLRETASQPDCLIGTAYDETVMLPKHEQDKDLTAIAFAYSYKLLLAYSWGNYQAALDYITPLKSYLMAVSGMFFIPIFHFYAALTHLALFSTQPETEQAQMLAVAVTHQTILHQWAQNAPMNHLHKWYLVEAERYRVLGEKAAAIECYDQAITLAAYNQFMNEEALANELAAKFYLEWGKARIAQSYMIEAYYGYIRWGAKAKVEDLATRYQQLLTPILQQEKRSFPLSNQTTSFNSTIFSTVSGSKTSISDSLDLATFIKASQAVCREIELEPMLSTLMSVVMENAGATKGTLILSEADHLNGTITAVSSSSTFKPIYTEFSSNCLESDWDLPINLINYVKRTQEIFVIDNAMASPLLSADSYIQHEQPKSLLSIPMINQGELIGILYLENNLTTGAFTSERVEVLKVLATQAAICLKNAILYKNLAQAKEGLEKALHTVEEKVEIRTQELNDKNQELQQTLKELQSTQTQLIQSEKMSSLGQLVAGIAHEINNPINFIHGNITYVDEYVRDLLDLIAGYQQESYHPSPMVEKKLQEIDLNFIVEDFPNILASMKQGSSRIQNIVLGLRNFSRLDEAQMKSVDVHEGIDSTLMILQHRLQKKSYFPEIKVIKEYGKLPQVICYAGLLNQVFMNLLVNAIDALEDAVIKRKTTDHPTIRIVTECTDDEMVRIRFTDNGSGMTPQVQQKIFDPFFTTKPVGSGTGLGLSICYEIIVDKHQGHLTCNSNLDKGTEFIIEMPLKIFHKAS